MDDKEKINNRDKKILHTLALLVTIILGFTMLMVVFAVGIWVGQKRADFSFSWAENYNRNFGGPERGIFGNFPDQDFINEFLNIELKICNEKVLLLYYN